MSYQIVSQFANWTIENCEELLSTLDRSAKNYPENPFRESSKCHLLMTRINAGLQDFEKDKKITFTAKPDPIEFEYHQKLCRFFEADYKNKPQYFLDMIETNCQRKMLHHIQSQLHSLRKEMTPYTKLHDILHSPQPLSSSLRDDTLVPTAVACEFKDTAKKCHELIKKLEPVREKSDLLPLNPLFQEILSDIEQFRSAYKITFRTKLDSRDIVYYDRLMGIYWAATNSIYAVEQDKSEEAYALNTIITYLSIELQDVIELCDHYQPQLEMRLKMWKLDHSNALVPKSIN